ncbi:MAG: AMP-binding protein [Chloroflexi bacterium]|nr:AMP-binding protein [Chloroflexota bacterium]
MQLYKFQKTIEWAHSHCGLWRRKLDAASVHPSQIKTLDDARRVPFMTKKEYLDSQAEQPPYGDILAISQEQGVKYHQTSGTSGRAPLRVLDGRRDWSWLADSWAEGLWAVGVRPDDVAYLAFSYGPFMGFWIAHYGFDRIGAIVISGGGQTTEGRLRQIIDLGVTVVAATPTYALRMAQTAREMGVDLAKDTKVRITVHAGEPGASIPATKNALEAAWGSRVADYGGMSESGCNFYFTCAERDISVHIQEDHYLQEVIDPITLEPVGYGERGELVITPFGRGSQPIVRYRTGDLVERVPASECTCGRTFDLYKGAIIGRVDDMKVIRGVNVYPSAVENIVRGHGEVDEFQIVLTRENYVDEITVKLDPVREYPRERYDELANLLSKELAEAHEGLRFNVDTVEPGTLPRFELKSRRLVDKRA